MARENDLMHFEGLTDEQNAKARTCKTPEEMPELTKEEGYELSDDELEAVSGGWGCNGQNFNCGMIGR